MWRASLAYALLVACTPRASVNDVPDARESPQAKAEPAPLATAVQVLASAAPVPISAEAGPPPVAMRGDLALPPDTVPKDVAGYTLQAALRVSDAPPPFKGPEVSVAALEAARRKTEPRVAIDLAPGHARIVLSSHGFALPEDTELRARADRYGFVVLLPGVPGYRVAAPGALRALLGERRIDVAPLSPVEVTARGEGARRLGYRTRRVEAVNRVATASFELARVTDAGDGGVLVCRALLDLMNAPPATSLCGLDEVPLHVELRWSTRGAIVFDAFGLARRTEALAPQQLAAPPAGTAFAPPFIPSLGSGLLVTLAELGAFRTAPSEAPPSAPPARASDPQSGLVIANSTDELRFLWLDGTPVAWVAPGARDAIPTLLHGRYSAQWRTFLGDSIDVAQMVTVPGTTDVGAPDAGR